MVWAFGVAAVGSFMLGFECAGDDLPEAGSDFLGSLTDLDDYRAG